MLSLVFSAHTHAQTCARASANPAAPVRPVYIIAGQSNASGLASVHDIRSGPIDYFNAQTVYPNVQVYGIYGAPPGVVDKDNPIDSKSVDWPAFASWQLARPGFGFKGATQYRETLPHTQATDLFGPELGFAAMLNNRAPYDFYIVKLAISDTSLHYSKNTESWHPRGHLYRALLKMIADAYNSKRLDVRLDVAGVFWMQGESDAIYKSWAKRYQKNLTGFIKTLRKDVYKMGCADDPAFPVAIGRIRNNPRWMSKRSVRHVRIAQRKVAKHVPCVSLINADDFSEHIAENRGLHFDEYGQAHLGARIYQAWFGRPYQNGVFRLSCKKHRYF